MRLSMLFLALIFACAAPEVSSKPAETPEALIRVLYDNHRPQFEQGLNLSNAATLKRYFSPELTKLFLKDAACRQRTKEVCALDFDPIFAAQDFDRQPLDLQIERLSPRQYKVSFTNLERRSQIYDVLPGHDGPRIDDIIYPESGSLKALLSRKP